MPRRKKRSLKFALLDFVLYGLSSIAAMGVFWLLATSSEFGQWSAEQFGMNSNILLMAIISMAVWLSLSILSLYIVKRFQKAGH